jgi:hypothetical protein
MNEMNEMVFEKNTRDKKMWKENLWWGGFPCSFCSSHHFPHFVFCILISILFLFFYFVVGATPTPCARRPAIRRRAARHPQELRARLGGSPRLVRGTQPSQLRHSYELVLLRHRPLGGGALSSSHRRQRAMPPSCSRATCNTTPSPPPAAGTRTSIASTLTPTGGWRRVPPGGGGAREHGRREQHTRASATGRLGRRRRLHGWCRAWSA